VCISFSYLIIVAFIEEYKKHSHLFTLEESFSSFHKFLKEWEIPENEIEIDKTQKINEGSYGTVYKVMLQTYQTKYSVILERERERERERNYH
jgi:hypothetical protein